MARQAKRPESAAPRGADRGTWDNLILTWRLYRDPRVSNWIKRLPLVLAAIYVIVPFDLIPDVIVGVGQLDDLGFIGLMALALTWLPRFAPAEVVAEYRKEGRESQRQAASSARKAGGTTGSRQDREQVIEPPFRVR